MNEQEDKMDKEAVGALAAEIIQLCMRHEAELQPQHVIFALGMSARGIISVVESINQAAAPEEAHEATRQWLLHGYKQMVVAVDMSKGGAMQSGLTQKH